MKAKGRPRLPAFQRQSQVIRLRVSASLKKAISKAAKKAQKSSSEFIRDSIFMILHVQSRDWMGNQ